MSNSDVRSKLDHEASRVMDVARDTADSIGRMAGAAATNVGNMASQAAENIGQDADSLASSAGRGVQQIGEQLRRSSPNTGMLGDASQSVARKITEGGAYLERAKLSGMGTDLTKVIQRNPIPTILVSLTLGWIASRIFRSQDR